MVDNKDTLIVQGDRTAKADWNDSCGPVCNATTNERGLRMLEFANYKMVLVNIHGEHNASTR